MATGYTTYTWFENSVIFIGNLMIEKNNKKILVIMTGGTICSSVNDKNERFSDARNVRIINEFKNSGSEFSWVEFESVAALDILSENMTIDTWNVLLDAFRKVEWQKYCGVIVLHGTDTLAYTASLLSLVLCGCGVPVMCVSAQLPLWESGTNGHDNFRMAAELIMKGIAPNVYAVYRNCDGNIYVHYGAHLLQCKNYSNDFSSFDMMTADEAISRAQGFKTDGMLIGSFERLMPCVMYISPYVGLDYSALCLDGVRAVVHATYHSNTVCVDRTGGEGGITDFSALSLLKRCRVHSIPFILAPCDGNAYAYESTGDALRNGAGYASGVTLETAYVKALVGCALGFDGEKLCKFMNSDVNGENICGKI